VICGDSRFDTGSILGKPHRNGVAFFALYVVTFSPDPAL